MTEKFKDIPVEQDTQLFSSVEAKIENYDVVYKRRKWDGIYAESFIFIMMMSRIYPKTKSSMKLRYVRPLLRKGLK